MSRKLVLFTLGLLALLGGEARGQESEPTSQQIWGNLVLNFPHGKRVLAEINFEAVYQQRLAQQQGQANADTGQAAGIAVPGAH